jgi:NDP-sugar pyrophosphorylase family protein
MIPALVLTAGLATRLRPLSRVRAKAALPVAGEPLIERILRWLAASGVEEFVLNLHHLPETITGLIGDGGGLGVRVRYSWETPVLGSAGGPRHALPLLGSGEFLIVNGDTLTDVSIGEVLNEHRASGALVTMALVPNTEPDKYGGALVDDRGAVTAFTRRGPPPQRAGERASGTPASAERSYHFIGVQVAQSTVFEPLPDHTPHESVGALYPELIRTRPGSIRAFISQTAEFLDIGTPADYLQTSLRLAAREGRPSVSMGRGTRVESSARLTDTVLWDDVAVGAGARVERCVVADGVRIPSGTDWSDLTIRVPTGDLEPQETLRHGLAVAPISR